MPQRWMRKGWKELVEEGGGRKREGCTKGEGGKGRVLYSPREERGVMNAITRIDSHDQTLVEIEGGVLRSSRRGRRGRGRRTSESWFGGLKREELFRRPAIDDLASRSDCPSEFCLINKRDGFRSPKRSIDGVDVLDEVFKVREFGFCLFVATHNDTLVHSLARGEARVHKLAARVCVVLMIDD